jgi:hypothetical protein
MIHMLTLLGNTDYSSCMIRNRGQEFTVYLRQIGLSEPHMRTSYMHVLNINEASY